VTPVVRRMLSALSDPIPLPSFPAVSVQLSASVGISYGGRDETADVLLRNADLAMYAAKSGGKSRYQSYDPAMHARSLGRMDLASDLRHAVSGDQLRLAFQPILRLQGDRFAGAEALLRWQHPTRGLLGSYDFIELAEETGAIVEIGAWVLDQACRQLRCWQGAHTGHEALGVAVNISGRQFGPELVDTVAAALTTHDIEPGCLTLEITEGLISGDGLGARKTLGALKELGVWLAIDDFGTGHSSLGRLRDYDFDELKIDRMFVSDLDTGDPTLVAAQIALAHGLGMSVVAEGVETQAQLDYLRRAGCGQVQGFLVARPVSAEAVREILAGPGVWADGAIQQLERARTAHAS
jgi:EAL domain-containing protein (putative c-di-GMP-specific phosphodiesterase class I)